MEFQNYKLYHNYSNNEAKLLSVERRQKSIINILKRECEKIALEQDRKVQAYQKLWIRKRVAANYTLKLPKHDNKAANCKHELGDGGTTEVDERKQIREKMIAAGNSFSKMNKCAVRGPRKPTAVEMKKEMLTKAKELGNRYSMILNRRVNLQKQNYLALDDEFDRLRLNKFLQRKRKAESFYKARKLCGHEVSDSFVSQFSRLVDEIKILEDIFGQENQFCCGKFYF